MYKKLLFTFVVSITTFILILSSLLYYNYNVSFIRVVKDTNTKLLSNISYSSVFLDNISQKFCQSLLLNHSIDAFIYSNGSKDEDILNISGAIKTLRDLTIPNTYIYSTYVYNQKIETIIDTSTFYDVSDFYDKEIVDLLTKTKTVRSPSLYPIPRKIPMQGDSKNSYANVYTYILFDTYDLQGNIDGAIVLNVDAEWLRLTISSLANDSVQNGSEILVVDDKGDIVSHSSPSWFLKNVSNERSLHNVLAADQPVGTYLDKLDGRKHVISYVSSNVLRWKFISMTPYAAAYSTVMKNGLITLVFCLAVLLFGLLFSVFASKKLYNPIGALTSGIKQKLGMEGEPAPGNDELGYLSKAFAGIIDKTNRLENQTRDAAPLIKNVFLKSVLTGAASLSFDELITKQKEIRLSLDFQNHLYLFLLKIDFFKDFINTYNEKDRSLLKYAIANMAQEITGIHFRNEVVDTEHDQFAVLVDVGEISDEPALFMDRFHSIAASIQTSVRTHLNLSITVTLGFVIEPPAHIKNVYEETFNLSMYRIKTGHGSIITPETLKNIDNGSFIFPASKEKQLIDSLKLGSGEAARENFKEIIKAIEYASYDNIITSVIYLFFSIFNSLNRIVEDSESRFNSISIKFFNNVSGFETFDEIERTFFSMFDEIIQLKNSAKDRKKNDIVNVAKDLIHANFSDKNLSLSSCAESLSISAAYLGKLFKSATGKSVAEYITMVRMEKIVEYLENQRYPINEILEKCGVEKSNYFYTSFKKYFGVSLTEYRLKTVRAREDKKSPQERSP